MKKLLILVMILLPGFICAETLSDSLGFPFNDDDETEYHEDEDDDHDYDCWFFGHSDTETLLGDHQITATGFGGPIFRVSEIGNEPAYFFGGRGGAVFNEKLIIGGSWNALVYPNRRTDITGEDYDGRYEHFHMFYAGPMFGLQFFQKNLINMSLTSITGAGVFAYTDWYSDREQQDIDEGQRESEIKDPEFFFVAEPTLMLHLNVTRWMRIGGGISYRYTNGVNNNELSDDDFRRWSTVFAVDFGWF